MLRIQRIKEMIRNQQGLTVVELAVVIVLIGALFPIFSLLILNSYRDGVYLDDRSKMSAETKQAFWYMDDSVRTSNEFLATVPAEYTDPYGPRNNGTAGAEAWSYKGNSANDRVLIVKSYATNQNTLNPGRQPVFLNTPEFNCTTQMVYQPQLQFVTVYFVKDGTLYKRTVTDTTSARCPGTTDTQKKSCPPYITSGRNASCEANDEVLITGVSKFETKYYTVSIAGSSTQIDPSFSSTDPTILSTVDYATISVTTSARNGSVENTLTHRLTKVNQL